MVVGGGCEGNVLILLKDLAEEPEETVQNVINTRGFIKGSRLKIHLPSLSVPSNDVLFDLRHLNL